MSDDLRTQAQGNFPYMVMPSELARVAETQARIEGKLDAVLTLRAEFDKFRDDAASKRADYEGRISKVESWQGFAVWLAGGVWALTVAIVGASIAFILNHR